LTAKTFSKGFRVGVIRVLIAAPLAAPASWRTTAITMEAIKQIELRAEAIERHLQFDDVGEVALVGEGSSFAFTSTHNDPSKMRSFSQENHR
jgi:hypothetical protein